MNRTSVVWGLDPFACRVAEAVATRDRTRRLLSCDAGSAADLHATLVPMIETIEDEQNGGVIALALFASLDHDRTRSPLETVRDLKAVLDACPPGRFETWLVLFLPPVLATPERKARTFRLFVDLEHEDDGCRYLAATFVIPARIRRAEAGGAMQDIEVELLALIDRVLADSTVVHAVGGMGPLAAREDYRVAGRRCRYAAAGLHRLAYPATVAFEHLVARFLVRLLAEGLGEGASVEVDTRAAIERDVSRLVEQTAGAAGERLSMPPAITGEGRSRTERVGAGFDLARRVSATTEGDARRRPRPRK